MPAQPIVIVIDDNGDHVDLIARSIQRGAASRRVSFDPSVRSFDDPIDAIAALPADRLAVVLLDYQLADGTALDWLGEFVRRNPGPVLILTSHGNERIAAQALKNGAADYLVKDQIAEHPDLLCLAIDQAVRRFKLESRNRKLSAQLKVSNSTLE